MGRGMIRGCYSAYQIHPILGVTRRVALLTTIAAGKKEPLAEMLGRIRKAFWTLDSRNLPSVLP